MKVLITGASGFIGRNLLRKLAGQKMEISILGCHSPEALPPNAKHIRADLTDRKALEDISASADIKDGFDACVHLAGQTDVARSFGDPAEDLEENVLPLINLLSLFRISRFIYASTGSVYEGQTGMADQALAISPSIPYVISKYTGELYLKALHRKHRNPATYLILRIFNPYGPYEKSGRIIPRLVTQFAIKKDLGFTLQGSGNGIVDPMHVSDTCDAILAALESNVSGRAIDICSGKPMKLSQLTREIALTFGIEPVIDATGRSDEEITFYGDPKPQESILGFRPRVGLREGLLAYKEFLSTGLSFL